MIASLWVCSKKLLQPKQSCFVTRCLSTTSSTSHTGTVKFWLRDKGYGFINPDGRTDVDLFCHKSSIDTPIPDEIANSTARIPYLKKGERVRYMNKNLNGLEQATAVTWLDGKKIPPERTNYLGGVHERAKRSLGTKVYDIMDIEDGSTNDQRLEKILAAFVESRNIIQNAEAYLTRLGMNPADFPTVKTAGLGKYVFKKEAEALEKKEASLGTTAATAAEEAATTMAAAAADTTDTKDDADKEETIDFGKKDEEEEEVIETETATTESDESPTEDDADDEDAAESSSSSSSSSSDDEEGKDDEDKEDDDKVTKEKDEEDKTKP